MGCCNSSEETPDWKHWESKKEDRPPHSCTDIAWLIIFILFCTGLLFICGFAIATGGANRLVSGYDSYGNTCGRNNSKIEGVALSGKDMKGKKFVFFLDPCNLDFINRKIKSIALCVAKCPTTQLTTYQDLKQYAEVNGTDLCSYDVPPSSYTTDPQKETKCPKLPVFPSKAQPIFNRCIPENISCYMQLIQGFISFVSDNTVLRRVIAGVVDSKEIIMGLCVLALVLSFIVLLVIRYISRLLVVILTVLVIIGSLGGTGILWWLYADQKNALANNGTAVFSIDVATDNVTALLVYAIVATVFTVVLLLVMFFMRNRVALTVDLFHVAGKVFSHMPLLAIQPVWTFLSLILFWVYWLAVLLSLGMSGTPVPNNSTGVVEYKMQGPLQYMIWYHLVGLIWISEFILAFQQMTIAGAVVTYYFTRNKENQPELLSLLGTPILTSMMQTVRYHLGTLAKGAFIITLVKIPRLILMYIHSQLKGKENACARCLLKACICCLWCVEKCLSYLNQNAYTVTAINSTNFCTSARDAFLVLVENALRVAAINTVGDFVLFLGKILVVSCTAFAGILALNYQKDYTVWVLPLLIACVFAFLVAHCFLSVFEIVVDVLFLCFAVDTKIHDGTPGNEYYADKILMEYIENNKTKTRYKPGDGDGQEMRAMKSGGASA